MEKVIRYILLPFWLVVVGTLLSQWFYQESYVTTIQVHHESLLPKDFFEGPLVKGKVLRGEITATYNNFGTLKLRINTYARINYDKIHFRLREKGHTSWDVENAYVVDRFANELLYGFGFPPIRYSKGKTYEFELWSENGTPDNAIGFDKGYHSAASQYVFLRDSILTHPRLMRFFLTAKILSLLSDPYFLLFYVMFLLPTVLYASLVFMKKSYLLYGIEVLSFAYMIAVYIFLPITINQDTMVYIFLLAVVTIIMHIYSRSRYRFMLGNRLTSSHAFALSIGLLVLLEANVYRGNDFEATRLAITIFYSIIFALILAGYELHEGTGKRR